MLFFKNDKNEVFGLSEKQLRLKKPEWIEITESEMRKLTSPELPLERQKENKKVELEIAKMKAFNEPYLLNDKLYQLNSADLSYFETLFSSADEIDFILADNSVTKLNKSDFETLKQMLADRRNEAALKLRQLKNQVEKAKNSKTLKGIQWR